MPFTYGDNPANIARDAVRLEAGDTKRQDKSLTDAEVAYFLGRYGITDPEGTYTNSERAILQAAAEACEALAGKYSAEANYTSDGLTEDANRKAQAYRTRARELRKRARGPAVPYVGGLVKSEKDTAEAATGRVQPAFSREMLDNPGLE